MCSIFDDTATTKNSTSDHTLSLHDSLPISWYTPKDDAFDPNGDTSVADACTALAEISSRLEAAGVALDRQGIVGFSQGACLASHFIWRSTANMAFLGSLTGSLPGFELPTTPVEPRFKIGRAHV